MVSALRPLKDGVMADLGVTEQMLRHFITKVHQHRVRAPADCIAVPSGLAAADWNDIEFASDGRAHRLIALGVVDTRPGQEASRRRLDSLLRRGLLLRAERADHEQ
jgi:hypothetical protein